MRCRARGPGWEQTEKFPRESPPRGGDTRQPWEPVLGCLLAGKGAEGVSPFFLPLGPLAAVG